MLFVFAATIEPFAVSGGGCVVGMMLLCKCVFVRREGGGAGRYD